jgi:hypothetical protein
MRHDDCDKAFCLLDIHLLPLPELTVNIHTQKTPS